MRDAGPERCSSHPGRRPLTGLVRSVRVGGHEGGLEADRGDVVDPGPAQPVLEERLGEVLAELRPATRAPHGAGVDDDLYDGGNGAFSVV